MRKLFVMVVAGMLVSSLAQAAPLNYEGTNLLDLGDFPSVQTTSAGVATVNGSSGAIPAHLDTLRLAQSRGIGTINSSLLVTDPDTIGNGIFVIQFIDVRAETGTFAPISGAVANTARGLTQNRLPLPGLVRLCTVDASCAFYLPLDLTGTFNGEVVGAGIGGLLTIGGDTPIRISIEASPWTIKQSSAIDQVTTTGGLRINVTENVTGFAHGPNSMTTSTAAPSGVVQLVLANQVRTNLALGSNANTASTTQLTLHFIPEPGLVLLLGSGVAGLALLGYRRRR